MSHRYQNRRGWSNHRGRGNLRGHNRGRGHGGWQHGASTSGLQNRDTEEWNPEGQSPSGQQWHTGGFDGEWNQEHSQEELFENQRNVDGPWGHQGRIFGNETVSHQREHTSWSEDPQMSAMNQGHGQTTGIMMQEQQSHGAPGRSKNDQPFMQQPFIAQQNQMASERPQMPPFNQSLQPPMFGYPGSNLHQTGPAPQMSLEQMHHQSVANVQSNSNNQSYFDSVNQQPYQLGPNSTPQQVAPGSNTMYLQQTFHQHHPPEPLESLQRDTSGNMSSGNLTSNAPPPQDLAFIGNGRNTHHVPEIIDLTEGTDVVKTERMIDEEWVGKFLNSVRQVPSLPGIDGKGVLISVSIGLSLRLSLNVWVN